MRLSAPRFCAATLFALALSCAPGAYAQALSGAFTIGIFRWSFNSDGSPGPAIWAVDSNGSHLWDTDSVYYFGGGGDIPVMGDWTFSHQRRLGVFRNGYWYVDTDDSRSWASGSDSIFAFGQPGDQPLTLPWNDGYLHLAVFRPSTSELIIDTSQCNCFSGATSVFPISNAQPGDLPVLINADGFGGRLAFFRPSNGYWYLGPLASSGNLHFDLMSAPAYAYGMIGDMPVAGDWGGTGSTVWNIGVYRGQGIWIVDSNGSHGYDASDAIFNSFGVAGDFPVMGPWALATMSTPVPGTTLSGSTVTFTWTAVQGAQAYRLDVGTSTGGTNLYSQVSGTTNQTVSGLPTNGSTVYVRLWTEIGGAWKSIDYSYISYMTSGCSAATMASPPTNSTLSGSTVTFRWNPGSGVGTYGYYLYVGTSPGGWDLFGAGVGTALSQTVTNIPTPTNSMPIYVTLWTYLNCSGWLNNSYTYTTVQPVPDMTVTKTHAGSFGQGQTGATYTIIASNSGMLPTSGAVTVSDALPSSFDGDRHFRERLELHAARRPMHAERCAGGGRELSGNYADRERGEQLSLEREQYGHSLGWRRNEFWE